MRTLEKRQSEYKEAVQQIGSETFDDVVHVFVKKIKQTLGFKEKAITTVRERGSGSTIGIQMSFS